jgi:hypothetical protein
VVTLTSLPARMLVSPARVNVRPIAADNDGRLGRTRRAGQTLRPARRERPPGEDRRQERDRLQRRDRPLQLWQDPRPEPRRRGRRGAGGYPRRHRGR